MKNNNLKISFICLVCAALLLLIAIFLPYATAIGDHAENLKDNPDAIVYAELDMTSSDIIHISMAEYAKVYGSLGEELFYDAGMGTFYMVLVILIGGFAALALLFALLKKPVGVMVFDILAFIVFSLQNWDYTDRGVVPSRAYDWGAGYYVFYIAAVAVLAGAIWMLIQKKKLKKSA